MAMPKYGLSEVEIALAMSRNSVESVTTINFTRGERQVTIISNAETEDFMSIAEEQHFCIISAERERRETSVKNIKHRYDREVECALALRGITSYIPNFVALQQNATPITQQLSSGLEILMLRTGFRNVNRTTMKTVLCAEEHVPNVWIFSAYAQVINAICVAFTHVRFSHNNLTAKTVALNDYGSIFTINYDHQAVIGVKFLATIVNYRSAQYSYVRGAKVYDSSPGLAPANIVPHVSSDIYMFTLDCYNLVKQILDATSKSNVSKFKVYYERCEIFKRLLSFYVVLGAKSSRHETTTNLHSYPPGVQPHRSGEDFCRHMGKVLSEAGYHVCIPPKRGFQNWHLPAEKAETSTWHLFDLNCLYVRRIPNLSNIESLKNCIEYGKRDPNKWLKYAGISCEAHVIGENIMNDPLSATAKQLIMIMQEIPYMYVISRSVAKELLDVQEIYVYLCRTIANILARPLVGFGENASTIGRAVQDLSPKEQQTIA